MPKKKRAEGGVTLNKRESFTRLGLKRTNKALHAIAQLQHLANPAAYEYTAEEVDRMLAALRQAVEDVAERFANPAATKAGGFKW
jgi:hypothetical protein